MNDDQIPTWIKWAIGGITLALSMSSFVYSNFETKEHAKETSIEIREALQEIKADVKWLREHQQ